MIKDFIRKIFCTKGEEVCSVCKKHHYDIVGNGVKVLRPETLFNCPKFQQMIKMRINLNEEN